MSVSSPPEADWRGLSLTQPWATLVAREEKHIETRSWPTKFRGPVMVHASQGFPKECQALCAQPRFTGALGTQYAATLPRGAVVAVARLVECWRFQGDVAQELAGRPQGAHEAEFGDYTPGRYGFVLVEVRQLRRPVPWKGALGLWRVPARLLAAVAKEAA